MVEVDEDMVDRTQQIGFIVQRLSIAYQKQSACIDRALKPTALSLSKLNVLATLNRHSEQGWNITRISRVLQLNQPKVSKIIQSLQDLKLITLDKSQLDARQKPITITERGRQQCKSALATINPLLLQMYENHSSSDLKQLANQLEKLFFVVSGRVK